MEKKHHLPLTIGAHNWYHANTGGPTDSGYGTPGLRGTYFWYIDADPKLSFKNNVAQSIGAHVDFRFRDSSDKFRSFFENTYWFYEAYGYVDTDIGRFKGGQIAKQFGLNWDDTWWGNVQYFDGLKLDTDYGVSWENTWHPEDTFKVDSFAQYFISQANISGSVVGANTQSVPGVRERNIGVIRVVPTWQFSDKSSLAVGFSGLAGQIPKHDERLDTTQLVWAADTTYTRNKFKIFGEIDQSFGVVNPTRFISGGPSDKTTDVLVGTSYRYGPITYRIAWSGGFDSNPSGYQSLFVPGVTIALTKNINLYAEYVYWDIKKDTGKRSSFENGFQLVVNWHL